MTLFNVINKKNRGNHPAVNLNQTNKTKPYEL